MATRLDAIIVDPSAASRMALKEAAHHTNSYRHVFAVASLSQAIFQAKCCDQVDVFLIRSEFGGEQIQNFIDNARRNKTGEDAAFVLVMNSSLHETVSVAKGIMGGADGFILPPFSVDSVAQSVAIAEKVKRRQASQRLVDASGMVIDSLMEAIDDRAFLLSIGKDKPFRKSITDVSGQFKELAGEAAVSFVSVAIEKFSQIEKPPFHQELSPKVEAQENKGHDGRSESYNGPSEIIKRKLEAKKV